MAAYASDHGPVQAMSCSTGSSTATGSGAAASSGSAAKATAASIPVYVAPTYQLPEQQQQQRPVHEGVGYIQVPMQASAQEVYNIIQVGRIGECKTVFES